jgi:hypothetical protein
MLKMENPESNKEEHPYDCLTTSQLYDHLIKKSDSMSEILDTLDSNIDEIYNENKSDT